MRLASSLFVVGAAVAVAGCGSSDAETTGGAGAAGAAGATGVGGSGAGTAGAGSGGAPGACDSQLEGDTVRLATATTVEGGTQATVCQRWTVPEAFDVSGLVGSLGALGHHALLFATTTGGEPDGTGPCNELELMEAVQSDSFYMLAGVSYESSGVPYSFPEYAGYQLGLRVESGTQLVFESHFLNAGGDEADGCAWLELERGVQVDVPLAYRTVLPEAEYALEVPAHGTQDIDVSEPAGASFRVAAASSHMHEGGKHFRMSIQPSDVTLYETDDWADPVPKQFDTTKVVVEESDELRLECSFDNSGDAPQKFPAQMCVGGLYVLSCSFPGAC
jgi:hypothetical protein